MTELSRPVCTALLAATVTFNLVLLTPELAPVPPLNDGALHYPLITRTLDAFQNGESIWDHWNGAWVLGFPVFHYYQHLPHIGVSALQRLSGLEALTVFNALRYLLLALFPAMFYVAARALGLTRTAATFAGMAASVIAAPTLAGFEMESYVWGGTGMYTQIWGMTLLPLAVAHLFRLARTGRGMAVSVALTAGLVVSHTLYGYMAVLSAAALLLVDVETPFARRLVRMAAAVALAAAVVSYFLVPYALTSQWLNRSVWEAQTKYDSYGHLWVLARLVSGELLDAGRLPVLTVLAAIGLAYALARRQLFDRIALAVFSLWLVLFFGRPTWGILYRVLPMDADLHLHRFIGGVHFGALLLIGLGAEAVVFQLARSRARQMVAVAAVLLLLASAFLERARFLGWNRDVVNGNAAAMAQARGDLDALIATIRAAQRDRPGRVFAGLPGTWGSRLRVGDVPIYALLSFHGIETLGFAYHAMSIGADLQYHFDERNPQHYELFNVTRVVAPPDWSPPPFLEAVQRTARWSTYRTPSTGYFSMTSAAPLQVERKEDVYPAAVRMLNEFRGADLSAGVVTSQSVNATTYVATVTASQPAPLMFKMNYHPWWRARVDDREQAVIPIGPAFTGVQLMPGTHTVTLSYEPRAYKFVLLGLGALLLVAIFFTQRQIERAIDALPLPHFSWPVRKDRPNESSDRSHEPSAAVGRAGRFGPPSIVLALALLAGLPFLQEAVLSGHDSVKYPARLAMFFEALSSGDLVPRWAAQSAFGYGDPSLNFAAPLLGYLGSLFMAFGASAIVATNLTSLLFLIAGALGFWFLGRRLVSDEAGIVSAAAFVFAPYTLVEVYVRGDYSEFAAMALMPWLALAFLNLWQRGSNTGIAGAALAVAAVMLSSAPATLVVMSLFAGCLVAAAAVTRDRAAAGRSLLAIGIGAALSAFYWLPAYIEKDLTHAEQMFTGWWEYVNHFVPPARLVSSPWRFDYNQFPATGETMPLEIGPIHTALVVLAAAVVWIHRRHLSGEQRFVFAAAAAVLGFSLFMCTSLSGPLWGLPLPLQFLQFPWRFLIGAACAAAVFSSGALALFGSRTIEARVAAAVIVLALATHGLPHARAGAYLQWASQDFQGAGLQQPGLGLTTLGEFRPLTATVAPTSAASEPARVTRGSAAIREVGRTASRRVLLVDARAPSVVQLNLLFFPGWTARIDRVVVPVRPSDGTGLIEIDVPAGRHDVEIGFENTRIRTAGNVLSAAAALVVAALMVLGVRRRGRDSLDRS